MAGALQQNAKLFRRQIYNYFPKELCSLSVLLKIWEKLLKFKMHLPFINVRWRLTFHASATFTVCNGKMLSTGWSSLHVGGISLHCQAQLGVLRRRRSSQPTRLIFAVRGVGQLVEKDVGVAAAHLAGGHRTHPARNTHNYLHTQVLGFKMHWSRICLL